MNDIRNDKIVDYSIFDFLNIEKILTINGQNPEKILFYVLINPTLEYENNNIENFNRYTRVTNYDDKILNITNGFIIKMLTTGDHTFETCTVSMSGKTTRGEYKCRDIDEDSIDITIECDHDIIKDYINSRIDYYDCNGKNIDFTYPKTIEIKEEWIDSLGYGDRSYTHYDGHFSILNISTF